MDQKGQRLRRNLWLIPVIRSLRMALIAQAIIVLYWKTEIGISVKQIFLLQTINAGFVISFDVPAGYYSDRLGRKKSLLISSAAFACAFAAFAAAHEIYMLCVAEVILAVGICMFSGTDVAILYETLDQLDSSGHALYSESRTIFAMQFTEAAASVVAGYVAAALGLRAAIWLTVIPFIASFLLILFFIVDPHPPSIKDPSSTPHPALSLRHHVQKVLREISDDLSPRRDLLLPFVVTTFLLTATYSGVWLHQLLWARANMPLSQYGWAWAALNVAVSLSALSAPLARRFFGIFSTFAVLSLLVALSFTAMGLVLQPPWGIVLAGCALNVARGVSTPIMSTYINDRVQSDRRATMLSLLNMSMNGLFALFSVALGAVGQEGGLTSACVMSGAFLGLVPFVVCIATFCFSAPERRHDKYVELPLETIASIDNADPADVTLDLAVPQDASQTNGKTVINVA